jgi:hypothetical protein
MKKQSAQDFAVIHQHVLRAKQDNSLEDESQAFHHVLLGTLFDLQDDEIDAAITDDHYRVAKGDSPGKDRGIDAIHIDERMTPPVIHFFNSKYTADIEKTQSFFPSNELDKISTFLSQLMARDSALPSDINAALHAKVAEIWDQISKTNPRFVVHFASNYTEGLTVEEEQRLRSSLKVYSDFTCEFHTQSSLANKLARRGRIEVNGKFKAIHKNLFEKSAGDIRALIVHVEAEQLIRLLCDNAALRSDVSADMKGLKNVCISEDAFDDNVRVYLRQGSKVNRNIKATVLSAENARFFYFNNGITVTCDRFKYPTSQSSPIIELENAQVVNGGQTIHALFEAYNEKPASIEPVELLCRIYETKDAVLSSRIAETTNSQTPVKTRDIRSIDIFQIKLEKEFEALGLYYERKRNQHAGKPKANRIDSERCGQVALAFYHKMPLEAKNKKALIFGDKYDDIFSEETTAHILLLPLRLFGNTETERVQRAKGQNAWLRYASYHILYALRLLAETKGIPLEFSQLDAIWKLYSKAKSALRAARNIAKKEQGKEFEDVLFFKSSLAKSRTEDFIAGKTASKPAPRFAPKP